VSTMTHRRTEKERQLRVIRRIIVFNSFRDRVRCETICKLSRVDVIGLMIEPIELSDVPDVQKGEVLMDVRGNGSFQR
jgi:hypothetical protein